MLVNLDAQQATGSPSSACLSCMWWHRRAFLPFSNIEREGVPAFQGPIFPLGGQAGDEQKKNLRNCYSEHDFLCFAS